MEKKINVGILFGGKSGEHEVSLNSAYNVINAIDKDKFEITMIGIDRTGKWMLYDGDVENIKNDTWTEGLSVPKSNLEVLGDERVGNIDVFFPVLHGTFGEDGTIQGIFDIMDVPYVGCGVLGSSVAMDKVVTKQVCESAGVSTCEYTCLYKKEILDDIDRCVMTLMICYDLPLFIKPANMGSSVGISKATDKETLKAALLEAVKYDNKVIIETFVKGREVEVAVMGNDTIEASCVGEIVPCNEFYDYEAKYLSGDNSAVIIPADLPEELSERIRRMAIKSYQAIGASGLSRVDFFVTAEGNVLLNEINTLPGFTNISMYPKLWEASGLGYTDLITKLIELAFDRYDSRKALLYAKETE